MARTTKHTPKNSPAEYTRLVSGIYNSVYAMPARTIAEILATKAERRRIRKPTKDESPDETRQRWRENAEDARAMRRALGLPAKGRLSAEQKRRLLIERERQTTLAKIEREESEEYQERQRALHREQQKRWAKANREKIAEAQRRWKEKNPDYHRQADADRYAADSEKKKAQARAYYTAKRERINAKRRKQRALP